jgi:hypothetical protein
MWLRPPLVAGTVLIVENAIRLMVLLKLSTSLPLTSVHLVLRKFCEVYKLNAGSKNARTHMF